MVRRLYDIDFRLLRNFAAIVEAEGVSAAGIGLGASQSTVSTQLSELERRLGLTLCRRGRAGFSLTASGQDIYNASLDLFDAVDRFQNAAATVAGELNGTLRLCIPDAMISNVAWPLADVIARFRSGAEKAFVDLSMETPGDMVALLLDGKRDIAIGPFFERKAGLVYMPIFEETHALYCDAGHPFARKNRISADLVGRHPFVARRYLHRYDVERAGNINPMAVVDTMEAQALLIMSGQYIGYLPVHYAGLLPDRLCRVNSGEMAEYRSPFYIVHRHLAESNMLVRRFLAKSSSADAANAANPVEP